MKNIGNPYLNAVISKATPKASFPQGTKKMSNATREDAESHANGTWTRQRRRKALRRKCMAAVPVRVEIVTSREFVPNGSGGGRWVDTKVTVRLPRDERRAIAAMADGTSHAVDLARVAARARIEAGAS